MLDIPVPPESKECKVFCKKVRNATCFVKINPFAITTFFMLFSFDTALQKSGPLGFDATAAACNSNLSCLSVTDMTFTSDYFCVYHLVYLVGLWKL